MSGDGSADLHIDPAGAGPGAALDELIAAIEAGPTELGDIADRLAAEPAEIVARERELDELEDLRLALIERTEAANERFGVASRLVERSNAETARARAEAAATLDAATKRAAEMLADAETRATAVQAQAEREAVARIRRADRDASERLMQAETEAQRVLAEAMAIHEDANAKAASALESVEQRVEALVEEATRARHDEVERLQARGREVEGRIRELLAKTPDLAALRVEPARVLEHHDATIDLTHGADEGEAADPQPATRPEGLS